MSSISQIDTDSDENIFSVSQISAQIQNALTGQFSNIRIRGEISGLKLHTSGHAYFNLKDESSVINAVCWRGTVSKLQMRLEEGLEVVVSGNVNTYPARSSYQMICSDIRVAGVGALMALLEERKKKLSAEGLFDASRKKPLPYMPQVIGVITSPTGAVIKDILHRISERFGVHVLVYPVAVQGNDSAAQVAEGIKFFNKLEEKEHQTSNIKLQTNIPRPDVLIVARGGGSIEDLWAFNEEVVVRAAAESAIPLISAVGHETDTTLIDLAADVRAPTPTAAAEIAVPVKSEITATIIDNKARAYSAISRYINNFENLLKAKRQALISPGQMLANITQRLDDASERLNNSIIFVMKESRSRLKLLNSQLSTLGSQLINLNMQKISGYKQLLESYAYKNVLKRGYSLVRSGDRLINSAVSLASGDVITTEFFDGRITSTVNGTAPAAKKIKKEKAVKAKNSVADAPQSQGDLF